VEAKDRGFSFSVAGTSARVALDHPLGSEMCFDSVAYGEDITIVLEGNGSVTIDTTC
jgi:hypothetical protein